MVFALRFKYLFQKPQFYFAVLFVLYFIYIEFFGFLPFVLLFSLLSIFLFYTIIAFVSGKQYFSLIFTLLMSVIIYIISVKKYDITGFPAHIEDFYYYLFFKNTVIFILDHFHEEAKRVYMLLGGLILTLILIYRFDKSYISRLKYGLISLCAMSIFIIFPSIIKNSSINLAYMNELNVRHIASFNLSIAELFGSSTQKNNKLAGIAINKPINDLKLLDVTNKPHIILIHQESIFKPAIFQEFKYDTSLNDFFVSFDKKTHGLRVETYGGASWLTEFSILTGLSPLDYGMRRAYVYSLTHGTFNDTILQQLLKLGYSTQQIYPMNKDFAFYDKFYYGAGMENIFDVVDLNIKIPSSRDKVYYGKAMEKIEAKFGDNKPSFTFIQTMSSHFPFVDKLFPEETTPQLDARYSPELNEYMRRLWIARKDYQEFVANLKTQFPNQKFLILHYGDHQPSVSKELLSAKDKEFNANEPNTRFKLSNSKLMKTYYAIEGINFTPPPLPDFENLDAAYLGNILLESAGLPLSPIAQERKKLMLLCEGRFFSCENQDALLKFHAKFGELGGVKP